MIPSSFAVRLFVILSGSVSVYVDGKSTGELFMSQDGGTVTRPVQVKVDHVLSNLEERHLKLEKCKQLIRQLLYFTPNNCGNLNCDHFLLLKIAVLTDGK